METTCEEEHKVLMFSFKSGEGLGQILPVFCPKSTICSPHGYVAQKISVTVIKFESSFQPLN